MSSSSSVSLILSLGVVDLAKIFFTRRYPLEREAELIGVVTGIARLIESVGSRDVARSPAFRAVDERKGLPGGRIPENHLRARVDRHVGGAVNGNELTRARKLRGVRHKKRMNGFS